MFKISAISMSSTKDYKITTALSRKTTATKLHMMSLILFPLYFQACPEQSVPTQQARLVPLMSIFIQDIRARYQSIQHMLTIKEYLNLIAAGHFQTLQSMTFPY